MSEQPPSPPWEPPSQPWRPPEQPTAPTDPWHNPYDTAQASPQLYRIDRGEYAPYVLPEASKATAGWALGLSIVPCFITFVIGAILAIVVLLRGRDGRDHGKGLAIAALCVSGAWTVLTIAALVLGSLDLESRADRAAPEAPRDESGRLEEDGLVSVRDLRPGDCLMLPEGSSVVAVEARSCSGLHEGEVYAAFDIEGSDEFPGRGTVQREASRGCRARFEEFVGRPYRRSVLDFYYLFPQERLWVMGDHGVSCVVYEPRPADPDHALTLGQTLFHADR